MKLFLGAFAKLWEATISSVMSVCLSLSVYLFTWNSLAPTDGFL